MRWGRHIDLIITDQRSYRSRDPGNHDEINPLFEGDTLGFVPEELWAQLDAGRDYANGHPPAKLSFGDKSVANYRASEAPQTMLGREAESLVPRAPARREGHLEDLGQFAGTRPTSASIRRICRPELGKWPGRRLRLAWHLDDWGAMYHERAEIFDAVRDAGITGFAIVAGDRHSFWAGYAAKALPPAAFEPVGVTFVGGSITFGRRGRSQRTQPEEGRSVAPALRRQSGWRPAAGTTSTCCCTMACARRSNTPAAATWRRRTR